MFGILTLALIVSAPFRPATMLQPQFKNSVIVQADATWVVPGGTTSAYIEVVGSGGMIAGGEDPAGGAGGGAYSASLVTVTPGKSLRIYSRPNFQQPPLPMPFQFVPTSKGVGFAINDDKQTLVYAEGGEQVTAEFLTLAQGKGGKAVFGVGAIRFDGGDGGLTDNTTWAKKGWLACGAGGDPGTAAGPGANGLSSSALPVRVGNGAFRQIMPPILLPPIAPTNGQGAGGGYLGTVVVFGSRPWCRISW